MPELINVGNRRKCASCKYRMRMDSIIGYDDRPEGGCKRYCCNYLSLTGHSRLAGGIDPKYCDKYEKGRMIKSKERWTNADMTIHYEKDPYEVYKSSKNGKRKGQI